MWFEISRQLLGGGWLVWYDVFVVELGDQRKSLFEYELEVCEVWSGEFGV